MPEATQHTNQPPAAAEAAASPNPNPAPLRSVVVLDAPTGGWGIAVSCESPSPRPRRRQTSTENVNNEVHPHQNAPEASSVQPENDETVPSKMVNEEKEVNINNNDNANTNDSSLPEAPEAPKASIRFEEHTDASEGRSPSRAAAQASDEPAKFRMRREEAFPGWGEPAPSYRYFGEDVQRRFRAMKAAAGPIPGTYGGSGVASASENACDE